MNIATVYKKQLTESQIISLLSGKAITYTNKGYKNTVLPETEPFSYQTKDGKTVSGYQWKIKK